MKVTGGLSAVAIGDGRPRRLVRLPEGGLAHAIGDGRSGEDLAEGVGDGVGVLVRDDRLRVFEAGVRVAWRAFEATQFSSTLEFRKGLDALDGSPVLDIKPYLPPYDSITTSLLPAWAVGAELDDQVQSRRRHGDRHVFRSDAGAEAEHVGARPARVGDDVDSFARIDKIGVVFGSAAQVVVAGSAREYVLARAA